MLVVVMLWGDLWCWRLTASVNLRIRSEGLGLWLMLNRCFDRFGLIRLSARHGFEVGPGSAASGHIYR